MKASIDVANRLEAKHLRRGLADPVVRAFVKLIGIVAPLSDAGRARALRFVDESFAEQHQRPTAIDWDQVPARTFWEADK